MSAEAALALQLADAKRRAKEIVTSRFWRADEGDDVQFRELRRLAHVIAPFADVLRGPALVEMRRLFPMGDDVERGWWLDFALEGVAAGEAPPPPPPDPLDNFDPRMRAALRRAIAQSCTETS